MLKKIFVLLLLPLVLQGCTRDDICPEDTPTTPLLIITFRDAADPDTAKSVNELGITPVGQDTNVLVLATTDSIAIPLNTNLNTSEFNFIKDSNAEDFNVDIVGFIYSREDVYVNRACAFKTFFNDLNSDLTDEGTDNWIQGIFVNNTTVENENEAHIIVLH